MRKLFALSLIILLILCGTAFAEGIDLASMDTDALLALREQLNAEINARINDDNSLIADGVYVAGSDIKPGMYRITCAAAFDNREFYVNLFLSKEDYQTYDQSRWNNTSYRFSQAVLLPGMETIVNLTEGMTIEIYNGLGRVEAVQPEWAP
ncbi:MAG: hypothetical protein IJ041_08420 [Clostridia bacterium]|nr:hypothetical protein [Clostridia bacterium]